MSEALILESVNPQYDERLFIDFQEKYKFTTCSVQELFFCFCFDIQNNICTQHVLNLYFSGNSMNNLSSYCGLTNSRMRVSDTDLLVQAKNTHGYLNWAGARTKFSISFPLASMFSFPSQAGAIYPEPLVGALANFLIVNSHNHHRYREMMCVVLRRGDGGGGSGSLSSGIRVASTKS